MAKICSKKRYLRLLLILFFTTSYFLLSENADTFKELKEKKNNEENEPKNESKNESKNELKNESKNDKNNKSNFDLIPELKIDEDGVYKYVQMKCDKNYIFVRGSKQFEYHKYIYKDFLKEVESHGLNKKSCKSLGGGRINKDEKNKKIKIYGYSKTFGRVEGQHEKTKNIIQKYYPDYTITWTNKGY